MCDVNPSNTVLLKTILTNAEQKPVLEVTSGVKQMAGVTDACCSQFEPVWSLHRTGVTVSYL